MEYELLNPELYEKMVQKHWSAAIQIPQVKQIIDETNLPESEYVAIVYFDDPDLGPIVVTVVNIAGLDL